LPGMVFPLLRVFRQSMAEGDEVNQTDTGPGPQSALETPTREHRLKPVEVLLVGGFA
jgi:hypothetical protein